MEKKRKVAVFDFDGTLTTKDTFVEFIKYACGAWKFLFGFLLYSPLMVLMKLRLYPNWKCKQKVFSFFFKGMDHNEFRRYCEQFSEKIEEIKNPAVFDIFLQHISEGTDVYVVSASVDEWIMPFSNKYGAKDVIGTKIETDSKGMLTGRFSTRNCYGQEKVERFKEVEPDRDVYTLFAYGDSRGDKEMIEFADNGFWV